MIAAENIIRLTRQVINEVATEGDELSTEVTSSILDFVRIAAPVVVMDVSVHYHIVKSITFQKNQAVNFFQRPDGMTAIKVLLPEDFCRFVSLKADSWLYPVTMLMSDGHSSFASNYSIIPGIGNGPASPVAYLTTEVNNGGELSTYIVGHSLAESENFVLTYISSPQISDSEIQMDERLTNALSYYAASLYLQSISDANGSKSAYDMYQNIIAKLNNIATL